MPCPRDRFKCNTGFRPTSHFELVGFAGLGQWLRCPTEHRRRQLHDDRHRRAGHELSRPDCSTGHDLHVSSGAEAGGVESAASNSATATTPAIGGPATPTGLTATPTGPNSVSLSWNAIAWATTITIDRLDPSGNSTPIATLDGSATSFDDNSTSNLPQEDTTYTYQVTATNAYSPLDPDPASVECTTPLAAPSNLSLTQGRDSGGNPQIALNWSNNTGDQNSLIQIERSTDGRNFAKLTSPPDWDHSSSNYTDSGLSPATHYWYRIQEVDTAAGLASALVTADATTASSSTMIRRFKASPRFPRPRSI